MKIAATVMLVLAELAACGQTLTLSSKSDSARYYYYEGWRQVMDEGNYTASEKAYRKMMDHDPNFLVGLSLLGRITRDLSERTKIEKTLEQRKQEISGDERLLLDNYIELVRLTNLRETNPKKASVLVDNIFSSGEKKLAKIIHTYPDETYYKAEYIEVIHRNHGPQAALDSLDLLAANDEQQLPFLLGYAVQLYAELSEFEIAIGKANQLEALFEGKVSPKPHAVSADLYFKMGELDEAESAVDKALEIDPGNIDAQRLKKKINETGKEK